MAALPPPPMRGGAPPAAPLAALPPAKPQEPAIDREKICPLLLRAFAKIGGHHTLEDYQPRGREPDDEMQTYTWPDATLRELYLLVKEVHPQARRPTARLDFAFVYPDRKGRNVMRSVGTVHAERSGPDDFKSLRSLNFQTGDFLDVAIF